MEQQNVFIAYHGTYNDNGSITKARDLFFYLQSRGIKCYFYPNQNEEYFAATPIAAQKSHKLILVANKNIGVNEDGSVKNNGVYQEVVAFWNLIYEGARHRGDARVYTYDGLLPENANRLHLAFQGVAHFNENIYSQEKCFEDVYHWIISDENIEEHNMPITPYKEQEEKVEGISNEVKKVFVRRANMNKLWNLRKMIAIANKIECLGISNNELTLKMDETALYEALNRNAQIEVLFLDPHSKYTRLREKEEGQKRNTIVNNTKTTLNYIMRIKSRNPYNKTFENLSIYTYSAMPRMNMIFIDGEHLLLQYYANKAPGSSNPAFYIKKEENNEIFDFYYNQYKILKEKGKKIA